MKEELRIEVTREGGKVDIKVKGICRDDLVYILVADLLSAIEKGERVHED